MSFVNTEQVFSISGVSATWLNARLADQSVQNSGGIVNITGPVIVRDIYAVALSGLIPSVSGIRLSVHAATSGLFSGGTTIYYVDLTGVTTVSGDSSTKPLPQISPDFLCRSGVVTVNSGVHTYDLIVNYTRPAIQ